MTRGGSAQPVAVVSGPVQGGPALRVAVVSGPVQGGPSLPVAIVTDGRPTQGNIPVPVALGSGPVQGGAAIPVVVVSGSLITDPDVGNPSFAAQNTTFTNDMGPDGFSWPQAGPYGPLMVDQYGKLICLSEDSGGNHTITYSNDSGATWADGPSIGFLTRGAADYNSADDRLEVLWLAQAATDGMLYRRYAPTRDGSNNITAWAAVGAAYAILDAEVTGTMEYQHPCILWLNDAVYGAHGAVVCAWCCRNTGIGGTGNEIRSAMRILSNTAADLVALNWTHIGVASASTIGNAPLTASYTALRANATSGIPHASLARQANNNLVCAYHNGAGLWRHMHAVWDGVSAWTTLSAQETLATIVRAGTDTGYASKGELLSKIREDAAGNWYVGIATWRNDTDGDTWTLAQVTPANVVSLADVYSAGGAHSYAPTGDIDYDTAAARVVVSYITTGAQSAYVALYNGVTADDAPVLAFNTEPVDIPLLHTRAIVGKLGVLFRDTSAPFRGWFGTMDWNV